VPVGKKAVYEDTPWWLSFTNIEEYDYRSGDGSLICYK
jgi:hypothetical protein